MNDEDKKTLQFLGMFAFVFAMYQGVKYVTGITRQNPMR